MSYNTCIEHFPIQSVSISGCLVDVKNLLFHNGCHRATWEAHRNYPDRSIILLASWHSLLVCDPHCY